MTDKVDNIAIHVKDSRGYSDVTPRRSACTFEPDEELLQEGDSAPVVTYPL